MKLYFGIHKHMHQPYYRAADTSYWDGEKDSIFGSRCGNYTVFLSDAINCYLDGNLSHAGISTSWSGSLIEQLHRCSYDHLCGGCFDGWADSMKNIAKHRTSTDHSRLSFSAFGFYHPLMPLIPNRDIIRQITMHRKVVADTFDTEASRILFPPETAFHVRMIPALKKAGINAVIYDSIHRYRSCREYPYAGMNEGMLPPNPTDQENPPVNDWVQLNGVWAGSKISPSLLKPEYVKYEDIDGTVHSIIAIPAERYIGNEDARGGFGALQYENVLGQVYQNIEEHHTYDPQHPPFFFLHSDGDNHGGGADSYYRHNTGQLVQWILNDPRFELTTIEDYLMEFPPDKSTAIHIEPGSWSGADNGDPQFRKWFSRYEEPYSPDLNSWAVLTSLQNCLHSLEDAGYGSVELDNAMRLLLTAETSCYWYWTGQDIWDRQVTEAANKALSYVQAMVNEVAGKDTSGPSIFAPWVTPENPGGLTWGQGNLRPAEKIATIHTFVYDINGIKKVTLVVRYSQKEHRFPMQSHGPYPSQTNPTVTADYYTFELPPALGDLRYYIEAVDEAGNVSRSSLERLFCA